MSGRREILEWVDNEWILNPALSVQAEYALISEAFEQDNRSSLDHILGNDKAGFLADLKDRKQRSERIEEARGRDTRLDDIEREPETLPRLPRRKQGIISQVFSFFKGLFR